MFTILVLLLAGAGGFFAAKKTQLIGSGAKAGALGLLSRLFRKS